MPLDSAAAVRSLKAAQAGRVCLTKSEFVMLADIPAGKALGDAAAAPARRRGAAAGSIKQQSDLPPATAGVGLRTFGAVRDPVASW